MVLSQIPARAATHSWRELEKAGCLTDVIAIAPAQITAIPVHQEGDQDSVVRFLIGCRA